MNLSLTSKCTITNIENSSLIGVGDSSYPYHVTVCPLYLELGKSEMPLPHQTKFIVSFSQCQEAEVTLGSHYTEVTHYNRCVISQMYQICLKVDPMTLKTQST